MILKTKLVSSADPVTFQQQIRIFSEREQQDDTVVEIQYSTFVEHDEFDCVVYTALLVVRSLRFFDRYLGSWLKERNKHTCSVCGYEYWSNDDDFYFCPCCGSKMVEKK